MNEVFDINKLPERSLSVRKIVSPHMNMQVGDVIRIIKREMATQLATKIVESRSFFWERIFKEDGFNMVEYGADCIVMTTEEYAELKRESFKEGIKHAQGFMNYKPNY